MAVLDLDEFFRNAPRRVSPSSVPTTFSFMFEDGMVNEKDMTREQLLVVIRYLMDENDRLKVYGR
jgi:hypothetical protein